MGTVELSDRRRSDYEDKLEKHIQMTVGKFKELLSRIKFLESSIIHHNKHDLTKEEIR